MRAVALVVVARREPPAIRAVALVALRVAHAVLAVDERVLDVLLPVVGITVLEAVRVEKEERVLGEEQRPAIVGAERQLDVVVFAPVPEVAALAVTAMIGLGGHRIARRGCRHEVGDQALVPAADLVIHGPAVVRAPMPVQHVAAVARVPVPLHVQPQRVDARAQLVLQRVLAVEELPHAQQARDEKRGLHEVAAVVLA